jgi:hypothetical protein
VDGQNFQLVPAEDARKTPALEVNRGGVRCGIALNCGPEDGNFCRGIDDERQNYLVL